MSSSRQKWAQTISRSQDFPAQRPAKWSSIKDDRLPLAREAYTAQKSVEDRLTPWLGRPAEGHDLPTARLPLGHHRPTETDIDDARATFRVFVWWSDDHVLDIAGSVQKDVMSAMRALTQAAEAARAEAEQAGRRHVLCQPNQNDSIAGLVKLFPHVTQHDLTSTSRPVLSRTPQTVAASFRADNCIPRGLQFAEQFQAHLTEWAISLLYNRKQTRLRVEFGLAAIFDNSDEPLTPAEFNDLLNQPDHRHDGFISDIKSAEATSGLLHAFRSRQADFYPMDEESGRHVVILRFPETHMEIDVDCPGRLADGALRFQVAAGAKTWRFPDVPGTSIVTSCPDKAIDWRLSASLVIPTPALTPKEMSDLPRNITYVGEETTENGLVIPRFCIRETDVFGMNPYLGDIEQTVLRTVWRFAYKATPYVVEVILSHTWDGCHTREDPESSYAVNLYADNWDELMGPMTDVHGTRWWALDVGQLLPGSQHSTTEGKLGDFFGVVRDIQSILC